MPEITTSYSLTNNDFIEAAQLRKNSVKFSWITKFFTLAFFPLSFVELKRIDNPYFFYLESTRKHVEPQSIEEYILGFLLYILIFTFYFDQNFPKFSLMTHKTISKRYQINFIKQENKTITINETEIKIVSANYREIRQWQDYNKFAENKQLFLLFSNGQTRIIPKRIFNTEKKLNSFRTLLENKIK